MLELLENHSVPERTTDLKAHGQLEDIDSPDLNHFTRRGLRSPRGSLIVSCALTDMAKRLLGVRVIWPKASLVLGLN